MPLALITVAVDKALIRSFVEFGASWLGTWNSGVSVNMKLMLMKQQSRLVVEEHYRSSLLIQSRGVYAVMCT